MTTPCTPKRHRAPLTPPDTPEKRQITKDDLVVLDLTSPAAEQREAQQVAGQDGDSDFHFCDTESNDLSVSDDDELVNYSADAAEVVAIFGIEIISNVTYSDSCSFVPASNALHAPHVVDNSMGFTEDNGPSNICLADGVATLLFQFNESVLRAFLDLTVANFDFTRKEGSDFLCNLVVARRKREVRVGFYNLLNTVIDGEEETFFEWDVQARARITDSGIWVPTFATRCGMSNSVFGWHENELLGYHYEQPAQKARVIEICRQMATAMIVRKLWSKAADANMKITIEL